MPERALRIGVDGRELLGRATGVGRYLGEVLQAWAAMPAFPHHLVVFTPSDPPSTLVQRLGTCATWVVAPGASAGTFWEQWRLPRAVRRHNLDVFFAGAYTAPLLLTCPFVVAIYDVSYFAHPEWFGAREGVRRRLLTRLSARRATAIVTSSSFSADEIVAHVGVAPAKILVAPGGAPDAQRSDTSGHGATVLFVGSLFTRRHVPDLIAGFARAAADVPAARLVLVGQNRARPPIDPRAIAASFGIRDRIEWHDYVTETELDDLYGAARVFAFLSEYEGFALTPLEAIARGVPPVLLDTTVAREVYDDAALFVAADHAAIGEALGTLLRDDAAHQRVVAAGATLLRRYSWRSTAARIQEALERAARHAP